MTQTGSRAMQRIYWTTWAVLLVLTMVMILLDQAPLPRLLFVALMVGAMLTKASMIGAFFMHLRGERLALVLCVVVGLLATASFLYFLIVPDAHRIAEMQAQMGRQ